MPTIGWISFSPEYLIGIDFKFKEIMVNDTPIKL